MNKYSILAMSVCLAIFAAGCDDTSTPANVLGVAAQAVKTGNVKKLRSTLSGEARKTYGNAQGLATLSKALEGKSATVGATTMTKELGYYWGYNRTYTVMVADNSIEATVFCTFQDIAADSDEGKMQIRPASNAIFMSACTITNIK